jgi:Mg-chelatase subunit ChlD
MVLVLTVVVLGQSDRALRLGPIHTATSGRVDVLVELPGSVSAGASDFELLEDGRATVKGTDLKHFKDSGWTAAVVLVIDTSGSMKNKIAMVKAALPDFVHQFKGPLALVTFGDEPAVVAAFDAPRDQVTASISRLRAVSKETRLYAAVDRALGLLEAQPQPQLQRIILVSDGEEESEEDSKRLDEVINTASRRRVAIDTIWTARAPFSSRDTMVRLSERTDGVHGDAQSADQIRAVLRQVTNRIDGALVVSFSREVQREGLTRDLGLRLNVAGVEPASMALESPIARSVSPDEKPPVPPVSKTPLLDILKFIWTVITDLRSWFKAAATVGGAYAAYTASYVAVRRYRPYDIRRFPFSPFTFTKPPVEDERPREDSESTDSVRRRSSRRVTIVDHGTNEKSSLLVLEAVKGPLAGERITIDKDYFSIGADPDNDLSINSDTYLSGKHAVIRTSDNGWVLIDEGSTNGTFVDGEELKRETAHALQLGQVIRLGDSEFQVLGEGLAKAAPAASSSSESETRLT